MIFLGVISSFLLNVFLLLLTKRNGSFSLKRSTCSHRAAFKNTALVFNFTVMIIAVIRMIYFQLFIDKLGLYSDYFIILIIYGALVSMFMSGAIPLSKNRKVHKFFGYVMFICMTALLVYFHFILGISFDASISWLGRIIALGMISGSLLLYLKYKKWGMTEAFIIFMTFIWDLYILFFFLFK